MDTSYYQGKLALITGGSEGIGLSIAEGLLTAGANVLIVSRDTQKQQTALKRLGSLKKAPGQILHASPLDITSHTDVEKTLSDLCSRFGVPDFLINNAGYTLPGYLENLTPDSIRELMDTNFFGIVHTTRTLLPHFYKRKSGHIVNVSSVAGLLGVFGYTAYCASKYAVMGFSEALRREAMPYNIHVTTLCPPNTRTPGLEKENRIKPPEILKAEETVATVAPEKVATALLNALPKNPRIVIPTWDSKLVWHIDHLAPWVIDRLVRRPQP